MSLSAQFLDELRARTLLSAVIAPSVKLIRAGREWKACCPFHQEKTPSFTVNDDKGFYHCFGCGAHGDVIRFLTDARGLQFLDAVKELAARAGLELPAADPASRERAERSTVLTDVMAAAQRWFADQLAGPDGGEARAYLDRRGLSAATVERFGLGLAPGGRTRLKAALASFGEDKLVETGMLIRPDGGGDSYDRFRGRLMIPIRDPRGRVIAFGGRILGDGEPKYLNSPETVLFDKGRTLYNLDRAGPASRQARRLLVVEGYMDAIALDQAGIGEVVAPLGTALTEGQLERLWRLDPNPILCFDGDSAGQKAAVRAALRALPHVGPERSLRFVALPAGQDPDDLVRSGGRAAVEALLEEPTPLSELVFRIELEREPLVTPEARAGFGVRLKERAKAIQNHEVRTQYLALFNGRISEMYESVRSGSPWKGSSSAFRKRALAPEMLAIARHGLTQIVEVRSLLNGLRRHPSIIGELAEPLASIWIQNRGWSLVREAMLTAALMQWPLEPEFLATTLRNEGLAQTLKDMSRTRELRYSFLTDGVPESVARRDLVGVIERVSNKATLRQAIEDAQARYAAADEGERDQALLELERLYEAKRANEARFRDFWAHESESGETTESS